MSTKACAALVERGDPDRFLATMAAPPSDRALLLPIYAFNLEVARAAWASAEPLIAGMRLQFWSDTLEEIGAGQVPRTHEVAEALAGVIHATGLPLAPFARIVAARGQDIGGVRADDDAALLDYLAATSGNVMWLAAAALGAGRDAEAVVRDAGLAAGIANWLVAVPRLAASAGADRQDARPERVAALAREGLARLRSARRQRGRVPARALPAMLAGWRTGALLRMAAGAPERVAEGRLTQSEFARRGSLLVRSLVRRW